MVDGVDSNCNWFRVHCSVNRPCLSCSSFSVSPKSLTIWFDFNCPIDYFVSFSKLSGRLSVAGQLLPTSLPLLDSIFSHFCQYFSHLSIHPKREREREREGGREGEKISLFAFKAFKLQLFSDYYPVCLFSSFPWIQFSKMWVRFKASFNQRLETEAKIVRIFTSETPRWLQMNREPIPP